MLAHVLLRAPQVIMRGVVKKGFIASLAAIAVAAGIASRSQASDHIDGVKTAIDTAADLTDVFAFVSPQDPNKVVLAMNVHGLAFAHTRFSDAVEYKLRVRPVADARALTPSSSASDERSIVCTFSGGTPVIDAQQRARCTLDLLSGRQTIEFDTRSGSYRAGGEGHGNGARIFAGVRSDPWFLDLAKTLKYNAALPVLPGPGLNGLHGQNVLSIVVEVDKNLLPGPLFAVTAQTVRK